MKTVVLGFDALDFRYLDKFASTLPNFTALRESGLESTLESTHPPWTGSAWPSMYTGTDPSHHGVYGFFSYDGYPDKGSLVSRLDVQRPAIWNYLSSRDIPSIVMNVPVTHPPDPINGILIPGYLAKEDDPGHPENIRNELSATLDEEYTIYSRGELSSNPDEKLRGYLDLIDLRRRAAISLLNDYDWEFSMIQVQKTDAVFHNFSGEDQFRQVYEAADELLGDILDTVNNANVIICSDHGIGPVTGQAVYVNEVLRRQGLLQTSANGEKLSLESKKSTLAGSDDQTELSLFDRFIVEAQQVTDQIGIRPAEIYNIAKYIGIENILVRNIPSRLKEEINEDIDWRASKAYFPDKTRMGIHINLQGREPEGIVPPSEYENLRNEIISSLSSLKTPDGNSVFEFVCRREEIYEGPFTDNAPDICFLPVDMNHEISTDLYGLEFSEADTFDHKSQGVFIGNGPMFSESEPDGLSLTDIAPIAMTLLEQPIPLRMTGVLPEGLLTESGSQASYDDVNFGDNTAVSTEDDSSVTERLEDLGYL